jgi:magnesium transporter
MQKLLGPIAEITKLLVSGDIRFIHNQNHVYFKKLNEKTIRSLEMLDFYQMMISNIFDIYLSSTNNQTNQSVTLLTKFATFFIPCTFITGIYGMNFDNMPELHSHYGYYIILSIMFGIAVGMSYYFNRKD